MAAIGHNIFGKVSLSWPCSPSFAVRACCFNGLGERSVSITLALVIALLMLRGQFSGPQVRDSAFLGANDNGGVPNVASSVY
jgi:hypothetical protein